MSKLALTIAVRYACTRRQFGLPKQPGTSRFLLLKHSTLTVIPVEFLLMDYLSHQRRLLPLIATTYALRFGMNHTKDVLKEVQKVPTPKGSTYRNTT